MASVRKALALTVASNGTGIILQMIVIMVLSRLLTPEEVGVYSVAAVLSGLAGALRDFGLSEYLIQEKVLNDEKIRAAIMGNILVAWSISVILFLAAGPVATFYGVLGVGDVLRVLALGFILTPFGAVSFACLRREMKFSATYWATLISGLGGGTVAILLAYMGFGYMSLAWSSLASTILMVAVSFAFRPAHLPILPGLRGLGKVMHFGTHMSSIYVLGYLGRGAPDLIIGRLIDMYSVGLFSRASGAMEMINRLLLRGIHPVMLPYYSNQYRQGGELKQGYLKGVVLLTGITWPAIAILGLMAYSAIRLLYGEQWLAAVPLMQILCAAFAIEVVFLTVTETLIAAGAVTMTSRLQFLTQTIRIAAIIAGAYFGLLAVATALFVSSVITAILFADATKRVIGVRWSDLISTCRMSLGPTLLASLPALCVIGIYGVGERNYISAAIVSGTAGGLGWLFGILWLHHPLGDEVTRIWVRLRASKR
jgi:O-antigen/teichoic acid export membrane protein